MNDSQSQQQAPYSYPNQQQAIGAGEQNNQVNLKFLFNKFFLRHWYLYIYTLTLGLITAYFYNWYATPIYFSSCTVLIKDDKQKYNGNDLLSQLNQFNTEGGIETEIGIIRSRELIQKTLTELGFDKSYYLKGEIKTSEAYNDSPIRLKEDTLYPISNSTVLNIEILDSKKYKISYNHPTGHQIGYYLFGKHVNTKIGRFKIEKTEKFKDDVFDRPSYEKRKMLIRFNSIENLTILYQTALKVDKVSKTTRSI